LFCRHFLRSSSCKENRRRTCVHAKHRGPWSCRKHAEGYDLTARLDGGRFCAAPLGYEGKGGPRCLDIQNIINHFIACDETLRTAWCPLWPSTLQHDGSTLTSLNKRV
ncbi:hypothetical protein NQZ68_040912, partial [Dissostichus eleginoides]